MSGETQIQCCVGCEDGTQTKYNIIIIKMPLKRSEDKDRFPTFESISVGIGNSS